MFLRFWQTELAGDKARNERVAQPAQYLHPSVIDCNAVLKRCGNVIELLQYLCSRADEGQRLKYSGVQVWHRGAHCVTLKPFDRERLGKRLRQECR